MSGFVRVLEKEAEWRDDTRKAIQAWLEKDCSPLVESLVNEGLIDLLMARLEGRRK